MNLGLLAQSAVVIVACAAVVGMHWLAVARTVDRHRHSSWEFKEAFAQVYTASTICTFAGVGAIAAVWLLLPLLPLGLAENEIRFAQIIASIAVWTVTNIVFHGIIVARIRRPKEAA